MAPSNKKAPKQAIDAAAELVGQIEVEFDRLCTSFEGLSDKALCWLGAIGEWSVKDVLAHLTVWEKRLLQRVAGKPEDGAGTGTPQYNGAVYLKNRERSLADIRADFYRTHKKVLRLAGALTSAEIETWRKAFRFNTYNHYKWASLNLRRWRRQGRDDAG